MGSEFDMKRNLIVNYLPPTLSQDDVKELFSRIGVVNKCKLVRNHATRESKGYAFIEYASEESSSKAITDLNGVNMEGKTLKVSYARESSPETKNTNVYIAGLPTSVDSDDKLHELFSSFGTILTHKLLCNHDGSSRGAALVRFSTNYEALHAIMSMTGKTFPDAHGPLTVKLAIPSASKTTNMGYVTANTLNGVGASARVASIHLNMAANQNATLNYLSPGINSARTGQPASVYVYGLQPTHTELTLYELFSPFGGILNVKLIRDLTKEEKPCKGYGFVNFTKYEDAYKAVISMHNVPFEEKLLQVSFKQQRSVTATQPMHLNNSINPMVQVMT